MKKVIPLFMLAVVTLLSSVSVVHAQVVTPGTTAPTVAPTLPQKTPTPGSRIPNTPPGATGSATTTNVPVPTHISIANCDVCGYCNGMTADQVPSSWQSCRQCVYSGLGAGEINPLENKTIQGTVEGIPTPNLYQIYTDLGCLSTEQNKFATQISGFFFSIVGGIAFLFFIYGAGIVATSRSDPGRLNHGKRVIYGSIMGLLFALFSVFIIRFIATGIGSSSIGVEEPTTQGPAPTN